MIGKTFVIGFISFKYFLLPSLNSAIYFIPVIGSIKNTFEHKKIFTMSYILAVDGIEITLAKSQIMNCIENIRLSLTIQAGENIDIWIEIERRVGVILKINEAEMR